MTEERAPDGIGRPLLVAGALAISCLAGLAVWSSQAPVASAVIAEGRVAVEGSSKTVQHLEGGIVGEIFVMDGAAVARGQPLLRLDVTETRAALAGLTAEHDALAARALRLDAELRSERPDFSRLPVAEAAIAGERAIHVAGERERVAEAQQLEGTLRRLGARRRAITAELAAARSQARLVAEDAVAGRQLAERGVATRASLRDIERALAAMRGTETALEAQLAEATAAETEARLERAGAETRRVSAIAEERARVASRIARIAPERVALRARLSRDEVLAPVSGIVTDLAVATVGGVVAPGAPLMRIVPSEATLVVEARVRPADRERLASGMSAEIRLPGVEARGETGVTGVVVGISADRVAGDDAEAGDHYRAIVALEPAPEPLRLSPGMPVTVVVPTAPRSVIAYLLSPLRDAIARSMREV